MKRWKETLAGQSKGICIIMRQIIIRITPFSNLGNFGDIQKKGCHYFSKEVSEATIIMLNLVMLASLSPLRRCLIHKMHVFKNKAKRMPA